MPPYTVAPVSYDHSILLLVASVTHMWPLGSTDSANSISLDDDTGAWVVSLVGFAVDHRILHELASRAT